jgi:hypothetical protein
MGAGSLGFSLVAGGPFHRLVRAISLVRDENEDVVRQSLAVIFVTWAPLAVLAFAEGRLDEGGSRIHDIAVHVRLLVVVPLLFVAERALHVFTGRCVDRFRGFAGEDAVRVPEIAAATERVRDSLIPELLIAALAFTAGFLTWSSPTGRSGLAAGSETIAAGSAVTAWYALAAFPVFLFLALRMMWRWLVWCHLLWRLSRLELHLVAAHPDRQGGLGFLVYPSIAFSPFFTGLCAIGAASWANLMIGQGAAANGFVPTGGAILAISLLTTLGPLLLFATDLRRARLTSEREYSALVAEYSRAFERRWVRERDPDDGIFGSEHLEPMASLGEIYSGIRGMRTIPIPLRSIATVTLVTLVPVVPLVLAEVPLVELAQLVFGLLVG